LQNGLETHGCGYHIAPNCLPKHCAPYDPHCWRCTSSEWVIDPDFIIPTCTDWFMMIGDCEVRDNCVSSTNYPNAHGNHESCSVTLNRRVSVTVSSTFNLETCCDHLTIGEVTVKSASAVPAFLDMMETFTWSSDYSVTKEGWELCFWEPNQQPNQDEMCTRRQNTAYVSIDYGSNYRTVEVSAEECRDRCKSLEGCTGSSWWEDGGCHVSSSTELEEKEGVTSYVCTMASSEQENSVGRNVFAEFVDDVSIVNDKTLIMSLAFIGFFYTIFYAYRFLTKAAKYSEIASEQEV